MTAGWPRLGGVWGPWKDKLPRLDHPVVSARTNPPASPRLASESVPANAPVQYPSCHSTSCNEWLSSPPGSDK
jgi:hypothetical protein